MDQLRELQLRFQNYLITGADEIEADIISTGNALAEHRLGTYYNAYRIRLIDCLAVDYAALDKYLGREAFEYLVLDYLRLYPSSHPSVRWFGRNLPHYLGHDYRGDDAEFLQELASYEWAHGTVFDAADSPQLVPIDAMAQIAPDSWPDLGFSFKAALLWLDLHWNIPFIENALDTDAEMPDKLRADIPQRWLIWRQGLIIHWRSLEVHEAWALQQAHAGANFATICEGLLEWVDAQHVALVAAGFLKQWITDELIVSLRH